MIQKREINRNSHLIILNSKSTPFFFLSMMVYLTIVYLLDKFLSFHCNI
jgi:hypothetical protein